MTIHDMNSAAAIAIEPDLSVAVITKGASPVILGVFHDGIETQTSPEVDISTNRHD
jgi:hypothetical protein